MDEQTEAVVPQSSPSGIQQDLEPGPPSPVAALTGVFMTPTDTFGAMRGANWTLALLPLVLFGLLSGLSSLMFMRNADMGEFVRTQLKQSKFASQMSDAQIEDAVEGAKDANPYVRSSISVVVAPAILLLIALVYWVCFIALGSRLSYTQALLAASWAQVPKMIQLILATVVFAVKDVNELDPQNPILSNPGAFAGRDALGPTLYSVLSSLDVFAFWTMALYVIGFAAIGKLSRTQALAVVLGIFFLKMGLSAAWAFFTMQ